MVAQRRKLDRAGEEAQQLGQVAVRAASVQRGRRPARSFCREAALASWSAAVRALSWALSTLTCRISSEPSPSSSSRRARSSQSVSVASGVEDVKRSAGLRRWRTARPGRCYAGSPSGRTIPRVVHGLDLPAAAPPSAPRRPGPAGTWGLEGGVRGRALAVAGSLHVHDTARDVIVAPERTAVRHWIPLGGSTDAAPDRWVSVSAALAEQHALVAWIEYLGGVIVHHDDVVVQATIPLVPPAGPHVLLHELEFPRALLSAGIAWVIWSAVVLASAISSGSASLRQRPGATAPTAFPEIGSWMGTPARPGP